MHDPPKPHFTWVKHILCSLHNTLDYGLSLFQTPPTELVVYSNADWVGYPDTRKSTLGYAIFLDENFTSWSSKHQPTVSRSSVQVEYHDIANGIVKPTWVVLVGCFVTASDYSGN